MKKICIGIAGFGVVGKAYLRYLCHYGIEILVKKLGLGNDVALGEIVIWDEKEVNDKESVLHVFPKVTIYDKNVISFETFLQICDYVLISPGIANKKIPLDATHIISELDIFAYHNDKPSIAITGSLGKTTIATLIYKLLKGAANSHDIPLGKNIPSYSHPAVGGNIGIPMLDLLSQPFDLAVLELSSFQLARNRSYRPYIGIFNNLYPNHLDWHTSLDEYFGAKSKIWEYQLSSDKLIISHTFFIEPQWSLMLKKCKAALYVVMPSINELSVVTMVLDRFHVIFAENDILWVGLVENGDIIEKQQLIALAVLPSITFLQNWFFIMGAVFLLGIDMQRCAQQLQNHFFTSRLLEGQSHRLEKYLTVAEVDFYDDSKATITQATHAAVTRLAENKRPIVVILGGLGKGIDRKQFVQMLVNMPSVKYVYYFGKEAELFNGCKVFATLEQVVDDIFANMQPGDQVLFSPSGASFDFFSNYQHRGNFFKELVHTKARALQ